MNGTGIATVNYTEAELPYAAERAKELILRGTPVAVNTTASGDWTLSYPIGADHPQGPPLLYVPKLGPTK